MHALRFTSDNPLDHLPRALDQLRRMGFSIHRAALEEAAAAGEASVRLIFSCDSTGAAETFRHRVEGLMGVTDLALYAVAEEPDRACA